jgi:GxxExxY protein
MPHEMHKPENILSAAILDAAIEVHRVLGGPGLLETIYEEALACELEDRSYEIERQKLVPVLYKGRQLGAPLRVDRLVNDLIVVECKAVENYNSIYEIQTRTYLRQLNLRLGIVINFGATFITEGFKRVPNGL